MTLTPTIVAEIVFLTHEDGGRGSVIGEGYVPHIVIQKRSTRVASYNDRGEINEDYLGVRFVECPRNYELGNSGEFKLELMYAPRVDYSKVRPDEEFTVREGGRVVAHGQVRSRQDPSCD